MTTYGSRGRTLEHTIKIMLDRYRSFGIFCQRNYPERSSSGAFIAQHGFDFEILHQGKFYAFDAKECNSKTWNLKTNAKLHQVQALRTVEDNGGEGFFLVFFAPEKKLVKLSATKIAQAMKENKSSLKSSDGIETSLNILNIKKEQ